MTDIRNAVVDPWAPQPTSLPEFGVRSFSFLDGLSEASIQAALDEAAAAGPAASALALSLRQSRAAGVAHPVQSLPDVRRPDAASWEYNRPAGVTFRLQI